MPWNSISDLPADISKSLPAPAKELFLVAFNNSIAGAHKQPQDAENDALKLAWASVKNLYVREGKTWAPDLNLHSEPIDFSVAAKTKPHIISGPLIEIDKLNLNDWGIPSEESHVVMAGLLGVPLKICSGKEAIFNEHSCDYNWDPNAQIGQIISTRESGGWIHATAKVTDPTAQSKLQSGTWKNKWSIFGGYKFEDGNRMRYGTVPKSVTLVQAPAYTGANFKRQSASNLSQRKEIDSMAENDETTYTKEQVDTQIKEAVEAEHATMTQQVDDLTLKNSEMVTVHESAIAASNVSLGELAAAAKTKDLEIEKLMAAAKEEGGKDKEMVPRKEMEEMLAAAKEEMAKDSIPRLEVEKLLQAATDKATDNTMDLINRTALVEDIAKIQTEYNIISAEELDDTKTHLMGKSAASLIRDKLQLERMGEALEKTGAAAVDKFKAANLPSNQAGPGMKLSWDAVKQEWS